MLVVINAQRALHDPARGRRSNTNAEENILKIISAWRKRKRPIVHIKHVSENPNSFFYRKSSGIEFIDSREPKDNEPIIEKLKASAFTGTKLEDLIYKSKSEAVVLVKSSADQVTAKNPCQPGRHRQNKEW